MYHLSTHEPAKTIEYTEKAIALDILNEDLYRLAMRGYAELGDRSSVAHLYSRLQKLLYNELNTQPMLETVKLYEELMSAR